MENSKNTPNHNEKVPHKGSEKLIDEYKINDEAFRQSSKDDFVKTVSKFHHKDETKENSNEEK